MLTRKRSKNVWPPPIGSLVTSAGGTGRVLEYKSHGDMLLIRWERDLLSGSRKAFYYSKPEVKAWGFKFDSTDTCMPVSYGRNYIKV